MPRRHKSKKKQQPKLQASEAKAAVPKAATLPHTLVALCLSFLDGLAIARCARVNLHWSRLPASKLASTYKALVEQQWPNSNDAFFLCDEREADVWRARFMRRTMVERNWTAGRSTTRTFRCGAARASCVAVDLPCAVAGLDSGHVLVLDDFVSTQPTPLSSSETDHKRAIFDFLYYRAPNKADPAFRRWLVHPGNVLCAQVDRAADLLVTSGGDAIVKAWRLSSGELLNLLPDEGAAAWMAMKDGLLLTCTQGGRLLCIDVRALAASNSDSDYDRSDAGKVEVLFAANVCSQRVGLLQVDFARDRVFISEETGGWRLFQLDRKERKLVQLLSSPRGRSCLDLRSYCVLQALPDCPLSRLRLSNSEVTKFSDSFAEGCALAAPPPANRVLACSPAAVEHACVDANDGEQLIGAKLWSGDAKRDERATTVRTNHVGAVASTERFLLVGGLDALLLEKAFTREGFLDVLDFGVL